MNIMANKLSLPNEVKEMKLGRSFCKSANPSFHTFRYDFMPASVDPSKRATVDIGDGHQVTVNVPHIEGSGTDKTVFKGSKKPYQKECVLIIDHVTGEITLEKLSCNVNLKKTRAEGSSKIRSNTPVDNITFGTKKSPPNQKLSPHPHKFPSSSSSHGRLSPTVSHKNPNRSPINPQPSPNAASMPCFNVPVKSPTVTEPVVPVVHISNDVSMDGPEVGVLSSSSSDSSSEDSDSDNEGAKATKPPTAIDMPIFSQSSSKKSPPSSVPSLSALSMPSASSMRSMPKFSQLSEDLKLSESDDSDC